MSFQDDARALYLKDLGEGGEGEEGGKKKKMKVFIDQYLRFGGGKREGSGEVWGFSFLVFRFSDFLFYFFFNLGN